MNINEFIEKNKDYTIEKYAFPDTGIIYFICEEDSEIIYIGSTVNQYSRFKHHSARIEFYSKPIYFFSYPLEECLKLEKELILRIKPKYNIQYIPELKKKYGERPDTKSRKKHAIKIAKQVKKVMAKKNIGESELAKKMQTSRQRVHQIINPINGFHYRTIKKIEDALNIKLPG